MWYLNVQYTLNHRNRWASMAEQHFKNIMGNRQSTILYTLWAVGLRRDLDWVMLCHFSNWWCNTLPFYFSGAKPRQRPRLNRNRVYQNTNPGYAPPTFTVVNEHVRQPPPEPSFQVSDMPRKLTKRNIITSRDPRARLAAMSTAPLMATISQENVRSPPEPHRQILDPKVQKEIAVLQGKDEVTLNSGPGPGVKGFRHVPNQTSRSLNERFTEERMVTAWAPIPSPSSRNSRHCMWKRVSGFFIFCVCVHIKFGCVLWR